MPSIHPTEDPALGWMVPCLNVKDLAASIAFYGAFDLHPYGGNVEEKWVMLRNRAIEIHLFQGYIERDVLNFRGGRLDKIRPVLEARGLATRDVTPKSWEILDPDGRPLFFDSGPDEVERYEAGQPLTTPIEGDVHDGGGVDLGNLMVFLATNDLKALVDFYERVGWRPETMWREDRTPLFVRADQRLGPGTRQVDTCIGIHEASAPENAVGSDRRLIPLFFWCRDALEVMDSLRVRGVDPGEGPAISTCGDAGFWISDPDGRNVTVQSSPGSYLYP